MKAINWDDEPIGVECALPVGRDFIPPQNVVAISTLKDALELLDRWMEAYDELRREHARLHRSYIDVKFLADVNQTLADNFEILYAKK